MSLQPPVSFTGESAMSARSQKMADVMAATIDRAWEHVCQDGINRVVCIRDHEEGRKVVIWPMDAMDTEEWDAFNCLVVAEIYSCPDNEAAVEFCGGIWRCGK